MDKKFIPYITTIFFFLTTVLFAWLWWKKPCPCTQTEIISIKHDTIPAKDELKKIDKPLPSIFKTVKLKQFKKENPDFDFTIEPEDGSADVIEASDKQPWEYVNFYTDSVYIANQLHLVITDTVLGTLIGRGRWYANLTPQITTTVTKVRKDRVKFYAGASFVINARNMDRWGLGPNALLTFPKGFGVGYYYDAHNNAHQGTFYYLIKIKK